ncbi:unnamed protein product [Penicillium pancosmium]
MEQVQVAIIGAGWHGIAAAKTYQQAYSSQQIAILDSASSIGGVWAKERIYSELRTNNVVGSYEFSDFPMLEEKFGVRQGQNIPGHVVHAYFEAYVQRFGLENKIHLNCKVETVEYTQESKWILTMNDGSTGKVKVLEASKLIVATGLTSKPYLPQFDGLEDFIAQSPVLHVRDFALNEEEILKSKKKTTVLGGSKSAFDVVYSCAASGTTVDWVIRQSGSGPTWIAPAYVGAFKKLLESFPMTRIFSLVSPCAWNQDAGVTYTWLHGSWLGRKIVDWFWALMQADLIKTNRYHDHPETEKLIPWASPFWVATSLGILNYPTDFFDLVRDGKVRVHVADIDKLARGRICLSSQQQIDSDILICCTGWKETPGIKFLPSDINDKLGFPNSPDITSPQLREKVNQLILHQFPRLQLQPSFNRRDIHERHPIRLARFMAPPTMLQERSIVFLGHTVTLNTAIVAEVQALWAAAYLNNEFPASSPFGKMMGGGGAKYANDILFETSMHTEFGRWRSPGACGDHCYPNFVFDIIPYIDMLLRDLGISTRRKSSFLAHWFESHGVRDYSGLTTEWRMAITSRERTNMEKS